MKARCRARLLLSQTAWLSLAEAGVTAGWLEAWLRSAGAARVDTVCLEQALSRGGQHPADWHIAVGEPDELIRYALAHGRRIAGDQDGVRPHGAGMLELENPHRCGWVFGLPDGGRCLLLPAGDIASRREMWLHALNDGQPLIPLHVCLMDGKGDTEDMAGGLPLESGLRGWLRQPPGGVASFNDGGYLPEEWLLQCLREQSLRVRFAESCTGGGMAERLSRIPGASDALDCAWVTYSNEAKRRLLKVPDRTLKRCGAVSREVAEAMARGGMARGAACVAATGIAGPGGGSPEKPVGTVWIAAAMPDGRLESRLLRLSGSRAAIRRQTVNHAFALLAAMLGA